MTYICVSKLTVIGSDNGLSPDRRQAIIWTNAGILLLGRLETNFSGILIEIHVFLFKKMHLKMSSEKWFRSYTKTNRRTNTQTKHTGHWGQSVQSNLTYPDPVQPETSPSGRILFLAGYNFSLCLSSHICKFVLSCPNSNLGNQMTYSFEKKNVSQIRNCRSDYILNVCRFIHQSIKDIVINSLYDVLS